MTSVLVPSQFKTRQGRMVHGDFYWVDVILRDGTVHKGLTTNGEEILGNWDGQGGGSPVATVPFRAEDIRRLRPHSIFFFREQVLLFFAPPK